MSFRRRTRRTSPTARRAARRAMRRAPRSRGFAFAAVGAPVVIDGLLAESWGIAPGYYSWISIPGVCRAEPVIVRRDGNDYVITPAVRVLPW